MCILQYRRQIGHWTNMSIWSEFSIISYFMIDLFFNMRLRFFFHPQPYQLTLTRRARMLSPASLVRIVISLPWTDSVAKSTLLRYHRHVVFIALACILALHYYRVCNISARKHCFSEIRVFNISQINVFQPRKTTPRAPPVSSLSPTPANVTVPVLGNNSEGVYDIAVSEYSYLTVCLLKWFTLL